MKVLHDIEKGGGVMVTTRSNVSVKLLALFGLLILIFFAIPAIGYGTTSREAMVAYTQPDGATFQACTYGDEYFYYVATSSGYLVQQNPSDKTWYYVVDNGSSFSFGERADSSAPYGALTSSALSDESAKASYAALAGQSYPAFARTNTHVTTLSEIETVQGDGSYNVSQGLAPQADTETSIPLITIVIGFDGTASGCDWDLDENKYSSTFDWASRLFTGPYSIGKYYSAMSNGKFSWVPATAETSYYGRNGNTNIADKAGDGIIHVVVSGNHGDWGYPNTPEKQASLYQVYKEALCKVNDYYINLENYDTDKDGVLETDEAGLLFIVAGYETSFYGAGNKSPSIWAHSYNLKGLSGENKEFSLNGVVINDYITMGETIEQDYSVDGVTEARKEPMLVGTVAHELGHYLGLQDLYDITNADSGEWHDYNVYCTSIMSSGSWGCVIADDVTGARNFIPVSFDPYCLTQLGYVTPTEITEDGTYDVTSLTDSNGYKAYRIDTGNQDEYYLIENRQYDSFDTGLEGYYQDGTSNTDPAYDYSNPTGGIVIWHIDDGVFKKYAATDHVNVHTHRPGVMPLYFEGTSLQNGGPLVRYPFYNSVTSGNFLNGNSISLNLYNDSDLRADRVASRVTVTAADESSTDMKITVSFEKPTVTRLAGSNALDTMSKIVDEGFTATGGTVVLATSDNFPDALTASGIAGLSDAPILLTSSTSLSDQTATELARLKPANIIICGGKAAISENVATEAEAAAGASNVYRCAGGSRSGTACEVFNNAQTYTGQSFGTTAFVVTGKNFADALAIAPYAYVEHCAIFLTEDASTISDQTVQTMVDGGVTDFYVIGGNAVVSDDIVTQLESAGMKSDGRLSGGTRYETCEQVVEFEFDHGLTANNMALATGDNYKDALSGGALCGSKGSVLLLASDSDTIAVDSFLKKHGGTVMKAYIFGGTAAVSQSLEDHLIQILG